MEVITDTCIRISTVITPIRQAVDKWHELVTIGINVTKIPNTCRDHVTQNVFPCIEKLFV